MHVYGAGSREQLPAALRKYLDEQVSAGEVRFEKADRTPPRAAKAPAVRKKLNLTSVTGTYEREGGSRFTPATLKVLALPGDRVAFEIRALNGGHTGGEDGTAPIVNHRVLYSRDTGLSVVTLEFQFKGGKVVISGNDEGFCGAGVTLLGTYAKTDDRRPEGLRW